MPKYDESSPPQNRLLATLPVKEYARIVPYLVNIPLLYKEIIQESGVPIEYTYFPNDAIISLLSVVEKECTIEVGMIGNEGMVGASILLGSKRSPTQAIVQSSGSAMRMNAEILKKEFKRSSTMQDLLLPYAHALLASGGQLAACFRYHTLQQRLCRWLLMAHDRAGTDELTVTQGFISHMLSTRRASITEAANALRKKGLIDTRRGHITITNRQGLEAAACSCYQIIRDQFSSPR
jgi:CRP-like cAMP-binding protein